MLGFLCFFFSSRRRHTISKRDWSSDVCSSDLIAVHLLPLIRAWGKPSVVSFHGADVMVDLNKPAYRATTNQMLKAVRLVLVRSESLGRALVEIGCPPEKIRVQRTGMPIDEISFRERVW